MNRYQKLMRTNLIQLLVQLTMTLTAPSSIAAVELLGLDRLESFKCDFYSISGRTEISYHRDQQQNGKSHELIGKRNGMWPVQYKLNSLGSIDSFFGFVSYITIINESQLPQNQYVTMVFNKFITSDDKNATGTLYLVQGNGMVFSPATIGMIPVGTFYCSEITVSKSKLEFEREIQPDSSKNIFDALQSPQSDCDKKLKD